MIRAQENEPGDQRTWQRFESALLVPVPEAEPAVDGLRQRLDPSAGRGVPAHVTILYPFAPPESLNQSLIADLEVLLLTVPAFPFQLTAVHWFAEGVVWLAPEPDTPFRKLTQLMAARWPEFPPYGGAHSDPIPHLTVGEGGQIEALEEAAIQVTGKLPISAFAREVWLMTGSDGPDSWTLEASLQLG